MSRKTEREFDEIKAGFDKEISKDIEKSKTPWHFINLHTYLHQMTANRIKDLYDQLAKIKMFLLEAIGKNIRNMFANRMTDYGVIGMFKTVEEAHEAAFYFTLKKFNGKPLLER